MEAGRTVYGLFAAPCRSFCRWFRIIPFKKYNSLLEWGILRSLYAFWPYLTDYLSAIHGLAEWECFRLNYLEALRPKWGSIGSLNVTNMGRIGPPSGCDGSLHMLLGRVGNI